MACNGALIGLPAFALVILAAPTGLSIAFLLGNFLIGFAAAVFAHATLTATMNQAPRAQAGLALGAWGAVQATAAGIAMALGGILRDLVDAAVEITGSFGSLADAVGYIAVYGLEIVLLVITIAVTIPLVRRTGRRRSGAAAGPVYSSADRSEPVELTSARERPETG